MRPFHIEIVTPDGLLFDGEVESLLVRTDDGDVEILRGHADFVASVGTGRARLIVEGKEKFASVSGGFLSIKDGEVKLVAITFEFREQIDLDRAIAARDDAKEAISSAKDDKALALAKAKLQRALARIDVAEM